MPSHAKECLKLNKCVCSSSLFYTGLDKKKLAEAELEHTASCLGSVFNECICDKLVVPELTARKDDNSKIRYDLIPVGPLSQLAKVYTFGSQKYDDDNWRKGLAWNRVYAAVQRHLNAFWGGEDVDPESGITHLAHAAWGMFTLMEYLKTYPELDTRVKL